MSGSVNKVILVGNLGRDPEVRSTQAGSKIVTLRIATSETWKDKASGEKRERTEWHQVVIFNEALANIAEKYLRKGSKAYVEGQLQTRKWQDQQGVDRYSTEVVLQAFNGAIVLLDRREAHPGRTDFSGHERGSGGAASGGGQGVAGGDWSGDRPGGGAGGKAGAGFDDLDNDVPF